MRFREATDADASAWQAFLGGCQAGDFLHDWAWGEVARYDGEPQSRFVVEADGGGLRALCAAQVRRTVLGRTIWYVPHGPVLDYDASDAGDVVKVLLDGLRSVARQRRALLIILEPRLEADAPGLDVLSRAPFPLRRRGSLQVSHTRLVQIARDDEALMGGFDKDTRWAIRRAEREGVTVRCVSDASDTGAPDALHDLMAETQRRAGFPLAPRERIRTAWRALGGARRAMILEARREARLLASAMLVLEGDRSFYLFSGSVREAPGEPKRYASYALQWTMMRAARDSGSRTHDLWGIAPPDAGPDHPWQGVALFKRGFGGRVVAWAAPREIVLDPWLDGLRRTAGAVRRFGRRRGGVPTARG